MALNKQGIDLKAIKRDQRAINKLPNKGLASVNHGAASKALAHKKDDVFARNKKKETSTPMHKWMSKFE